MRFVPFELERWQSTWENRVRYNLSESGVHPLSIRELLDLAGAPPEPLLDVRSKLIEGAADNRPQFGRGRLQPLFGDPIQHAGLAAQPGVAQRLPGGLIACGCGVPLELRTKSIEAGGHFRRRGDTQCGERLSNDVRYFGHANGTRESLHQRDTPRRRSCRAASGGRPLPGKG